MPNVPDKFYELCRLCLSCSGVKLSIFDDEGTQRNYPLKIMTCLSILVSEQDKLPSNICESCTFKLDLFHEFKENCRKSEIILKRYITNSDYMSKDAQEYLNGIAALASRDPIPKKVEDCRNEHEMKEDTIEQINIDQTNGILDDKMCDDIDSDDEGVLRIAESEPETSYSTQDDCKIEDDDMTGKSRHIKSEVMSEEDTRSVDEALMQECLTHQIDGEGAKINTNSVKSESNSLLRSLMSGAPLNSRIPPPHGAYSKENEVLTNRTNLPTPVVQFNTEVGNHNKVDSRQSSGRRKQSCPLRATEVPFLNQSAPSYPLHNNNGSYNGVTITPVDPYSRSREAISRLLEAAHYTEREERGSGSPDTAGEGAEADAEEDIEEVEVSGGEDQTNSSWCGAAVFRPGRQPSLAKRVDLACSNCGTRTTTIWRRNPLGEMVCNACGLYYKLHNVNRPVTMRRDTIHTRRRRPKGDKPPRSSKKANSSECTSGGNSGSEECDDMLVALRRQIQPHLMLAALQQSSSYALAQQQTQQQQQQMHHEYRLFWGNVLHLNMIRN
uniref:Uncharacterized protein n=1 Tax=Clastoptera arizonana TaxID=38151 RepID=A0A1B6DJR1_9HEMI